MQIKREIRSPFMIKYTKRDPQGWRARERSQRDTFWSQSPIVGPPPTTHTGNYLRGDLESPQNFDLPKILKRFPATVFAIPKIDDLPHFLTIL